ncbi:MAG: T9SS type A sorting domain-containing protein [Bacteroidetes bacterium]|nr:T9SS type A sorting domain-containing protein [Bacteroidota bacterium]
MRTRFIYTLALLFCASIIKVNAQANSVLLKDGAGTLISSHNSIGNAYAAIPGTLTQPYIIEIDVTYTGSVETYPITFVAKTGASAVNTITLRPTLGVTSLTIQTTIAVANSGVFVLNDADWVVIDGRPGGTGNTSALVFSNLSVAANGNTVVFINGACNNVMRNCIVLNATTTGTGRGIFLAASANNVSGNSNNLFKYVSLIGGRYMFNSSGTALNANTENVIFGCSFQNSVFASFWGQAGTKKVTFDSCSFSATTPVGSGLYFGILYDSQTDSAIIKNNRFYDFQHTGTGEFKYISVRTVTGVNFTDVQNNFFSLMTGNFAQTNIGLVGFAGTDAHARVIHNSFRVGGVQTAAGTNGAVNSSALVLSSTSALSGYEIRNNLFVNERTGGTNVQHVGFNVTNAAPSFTIQDNTYNSTSGDLARWTTTAYNTIAGWQGVVPGGEPNANNAAFSYVSNNDLHLSTPTNTNLLAPQVSGITTDIDGAARPLSTYRGADEPITGPVIFVNSGAICFGDSFTITPSGATNYTYSGGSAVVSPTVSTNYTVTGDNSAIAISVVTVYTLPIVSASSGSICAGDIYTMSVNGANSYSVNGVAENSFTFSPSSTNTYSITGEDTHGCLSSNTAVASITVNSLPVINVNSGAVCMGNSFTIVPSGALNYSYSGGSSVVNPTVNTNYTVTGEDANLCLNTAVSSVSVLALPTISVNSGSICAGDYFTIIALGNAISYTFSSGGSNVNPPSNENYTVTGKDANGCQNTAISSVTVISLPNVSVNSGAVCVGNSFTIIPTGAINYTYSGGSNVVTPTANENYTITGTGSNGCKNTAISSVTAIALPLVSLASANSSVCLNEPAVTLSGSPVGGTYSGTNVSSSVFTPVSTGTFAPTYSYTNPNTGCSNTASVSIVVSACTGLSENSHLSGLMVYPNPTESRINIELNNGLEKRIMLIDITGKIVYETKTASNFETVDLTNFSSGVYILHIQSDTQNKMVKIIKQ